VFDGVIEQIPNILFSDKPQQLVVVLKDPPAEMINKRPNLVDTTITELVADSTGKLHFIYWHGDFSIRSLKPTQIYT